MPLFHPDNSAPMNGEVFVFGSNLAGRHGAGAALAAWRHYGAQYNRGVGPMGNSYAIPTKDSDLRCMTAEQIQPYVAEFVAYTQSHPYVSFLVTRVGCGLAGNADSVIAPMFKDCGDNCSFAEQWRPYLT